MAIGVFFLGHAFRTPRRQRYRRLKNIKKTVGILVLLGVFFSPIVASAIIPLLVGASYYFAADSAIVNALGAATILVGSALAWVSFGHTNGQPVTLANAPLRVQLNYESPPPAPANWRYEANFLIPPDVSVKPSAFGWGWSSNVSSSMAEKFVYGRSTAQEAALSLCKAYPASSSSVSVQQFGVEELRNYPVPGTPTRSYRCLNSSGGFIGSVSVVQSEGCEFGYEWNSVSCYIKFPDYVQKPLDGKCDIYFAGSFEKDAIDPDCKSMTEATVTASRVEVHDQFNAVAGGRVMKTPDGRVTVVDEKRNTSNGQINYEYYVVETGTNAGGGATATVVEKGAGNGRGPGYDSAAPGSGTGTGTGTGTGGTGTCGGAGQPACSTGGAAVCGAAPLPPCTIDLGGQSPAPGDPTATTSAELNTALELPLLQSFKTFSLPGHVSECPRPSFTWRATSYVIEAHCALLDAHTALLRAAMALVFSIGALFTVLRA